MTPVEIGKGRSFKGLAQYLLFPKPDAAEAQAEDLTQDLSQPRDPRVGWTASFNLMDARAETAWKLMTYTAGSADALKAAAGVRVGKKTAQPVYHYSLNFHPDDTPDEATQKAAVVSSLEALGLSEHQALAVMHKDRAHTHVHVMVNLIHPEHGVSAASKQPDGRPAPLSNTQRKLSAWALQFESEHGLKVTQGRLDNAQARAQGQSVDARRVPRNLFEQRQAEGNDARRAWQRREQEDRKARIAAEQRGTRSRQKEEWAALTRDYAERKAAHWKERPSFKDIARAVKEEAKPLWADLYRRQREQLQEFERTERKPLGLLWNAIATVFEVGREKGAFSGIAAALSKEERQGHLIREHQAEAAFLAQSVRIRIRDAIEAAKAAHQAQGDRMREAYLDQCKALRDTHRQAWGGLKANWRSYNDERRQAAAAARAPRPANDRGRPQAATKDQGLGRSRSREREP